MAVGRKVKLGVLIWVNQDYGRRVLSGVLDYASTNNLDEAVLLSAEAFEAQRARLKEIDGAIAVLGHNEWALLNKLPRPRLLVSDASAPGRRLCVTPDSRLVARLAVQHFASLKLPRMVALGQSSPVAFHELAAGFSEAGRQQGLDVLPAQEFIRDDANGIAWLRTLPLPCGVLGQRDSIGIRVTRWAQASGLRVPDDIAVMGIGDDLLECMRNRPTMSSVALPAERLGFLGAELMDRKLHGEKVSSLRVPPTGVTVRASTNTLVVKDQLVAEAVRFIRLHFADRIETPDVAKHVALSRRMLEYRFRDAMNCSVHDEIVRCRLEKATQLLRNTDEPVFRTAIACGFSELANFNRFIKKHTGHAPREYRCLHARTAQTMRKRSRADA